MACYSKPFIASTKALGEKRTLPNSARVTRPIRTFVPSNVASGTKATLALRRFTELTMGVELHNASPHQNRVQPFQAFAHWQKKST
jgi:hypothetical protein